MSDLNNVVSIMNIRRFSIQLKLVGSKPDLTLKDVICISLK
jgi:hypothetical protein